MLLLLLLLTVVPFVELAILLRLADATGWMTTLGIVIVTGVVGAWLARREGLRTLLTIQSELSTGRMPAMSVVEGMMILVAGALLVTPGILTDTVGFALLIPPVRRWVARRVAKAFRGRVVVMHPPGQEPFVDVPGEGRDVEPGERDAMIEDNALPGSKGTP